MAMHYYHQQLQALRTGLACNGCGATMVFYSAPAALIYGL